MNVSISNFGSFLCFSSVLCFLFYYNVNIGLPELILYVCYSFCGIYQIFVFLFYFVGEILFFINKAFYWVCILVSCWKFQDYLFSSCSILITSFSFLRRERAYNVLSVLLDLLSVWASPLLGVTAAQSASPFPFAFVMTPLSISQSLPFCSPG